MAETRRLACVLSVALVVSTIACSKPIQPTVVYPGLPFNLAPGRGVVIPDSLTVTFDRVTSDSRCPTDVKCITAGDAVVHLIINESASRVERDVHTASGDASKTTVSNYTIRLIDLTPYPRSTRVIDPADYTVTLQITSP